MCASKSIIIVLFLIITRTACLNCDKVSTGDSQAYEDFINLFNHIPTLMVSTPPPISEVTLRQLFDTASGKNKTIVNDWSKVSEDFNLKINGLKCTYEYVTMKMLHHLLTIKYDKKTILLYRKYTWRMLSVLFLARTTAPRQLWNISAMLTAASQKPINDEELLKCMTLNANSRILEKCIENNIITSKVLPKTSSVSSNDHGNEVTEILVSLSLSDGNEGDMIGIYRYSQEFDVYGLYEKIVTSLKLSLPPGQFSLYTYYNNKEFLIALANCVELVQKTWKTDYSMILLFTDFIKNTLMLMTSTLVLHYCFVAKNMWVDYEGKLELPFDQLAEVSKSYESVLDTVNYVCRFLAMENDSFFQSDVHLALKQNVTKKNVNILLKEVLELYSIFTKKLGLKYYDKNINKFTTKNHLENMILLIKFGSLLVKYCQNNIKELIKPLNFKTIKYFELSMRSTSDEDI